MGFFTSVLLAAVADKDDDEDEWDTVLRDDDVVIGGIDS